MFNLRNNNIVFSEKKGEGKEDYSVLSPSERRRSTFIIYVGAKCRANNK